MKVEKNIVNAAQIELTVEAEAADIEKYLAAAANNLSQQVKVAGFRAGKAPYQVMKAQVGDMVVWEEAAKLFITKKLDDIVADNCPRPSLGMPQVSISKLAPNNSLEFKVKVEMLPEVKLGDYKNFNLKAEAVEVSDQEIAKALEELRESRTKEALVDRPVAEGDKVLVDIKMFLDKVPVDGGQSPDTAVIIGKDYLIPGFDEKLLGATKGEAREFTLVYPETHFQKNIAGKKVEFAVMVKEIYARNLPPLDDELAVSFGLKDLADLRQAIRQSLLAEKERQAQDKVRAKMLDRLIASTEFGELPAGLIETELETMLAELEHSIAAYGAKFEDYLASIKKTKDDLKVDWHADAVKRVQAALALRLVAEQENIRPSEENIEHELEHLKEHYQNDKRALEVLGSPAYKRRLALEMASRETVAKLAEWNIK
jgi:trigger factor